MAVNPDGKVIISTRLDNSQIPKGVKEVKGALGGLKSVVGSLGAAIAGAFSVMAIVKFATESVKAANQLSDALTGLKSILDGQGRSFSDAQKFLEEYTADGLVPMANAITAYKNLASRGYDDTQIKQTLVALKDASAFGRQASYSMGEAVESATEGLKNENSVLVDNAGVTKNVAKMWEEYAASIGTTANNLTQQQKIQAEVNGILTESRFQAGDAAKVAGTLSGQLAQLSVNFTNLKVAVGNALKPIVQSFLPVINSAITTITRFVNILAEAMSLIFGQVSVETESVVESAEKAAEAEKEFEESIVSAGKAAKKALAGFDELNVMQSNAAGDGSGGGVGADSLPNASIIGSSEIGEGVISKEAERIAGIIKTIADYVPVIVTALAGLKLGAFISDLLTANTEAKTLKKTIGLLAKKTGITLGITLTFAGGALETKGIVGAIEEGLSGANFAEILLGGSGLAGGLSMALKSILPTVTIAGETVSGALLGGALGGITAGIPAFITGIYDAIVGGIDWLNAALVGAGATAAGAGVGAIVGMVGGPIGAGVGALIGLAIGLVTDLVILIVQKWDEICEFFAPVADWFNENVIQPTGDFFAGLWENITQFASTCWDGIVQLFTPAVSWFSDLFESIGRTVSDIFYNIGVIASGCWEVIKTAWNIAATWFDETIIQPIAELFTDIWDSVAYGASKAWEGIKSAFSSVATWFGDIFGEAWEGVKNIFSVGGEIFSGIVDGILDAFKAIVNTIIKGINAVVAIPFNGINAAIDTIRNINILGLTPFSGLRTISVPQIPYLAKGAVLPANKPFLAMVGDQKHGTNVEAPLATIQEAVAIVMEDMIQSNIAGHEATVGMLRQILEAVLSIDTSDERYAEAVDNYRRKMAVAKGAF